MKNRLGSIIAVLLSLGLVAVGCSSGKSTEQDEESVKKDMHKEEMADEQAMEEAAEEEMAEEQAMEEAGETEEASASGPAIDGYCPVAYKMAGKPIEGKEEFAVEHGGETWYLANEKAMKAFQENPGNYQVKYAGWCATGLAMGKQVQADPTIFMVHSEKIYLFSSEEAKKKFEAKAAEMSEKAESNWTAMQSADGEEGMDEGGEEGM
jgi:YHS domain-containing protein